MTSNNDDPTKINLSQTPSLATLIAFEKFSACLSVTKAAKDLNRSPSTISQAINDLENRSGGKLFDRSSGAIRLTDVGTQYLKQVREVLRILNHSGRTISEAMDRSVLRLYASQLFANTVLVPKLSQFKTLFPDIELEIDIGRNKVDWSKSSLDIEIGEENLSDDRLINLDLGVVKLMPICSPKLLNGQNKIKHIQDLEHATLIHDKHRPKDWERWLTVNGYPDLRPKNQLYFDDIYAPYQAARNGLGVALATFPFFVLAPGYGTKIVTAFPDKKAIEPRYKFIYRKDNPREGEFSKLHKWMREIFVETVILRDS